MALWMAAVKDVTEKPPRRSFKHRQKEFASTVARRNQRRSFEHRHSIWPTAYSDILVLVTIATAISFFLFDRRLIQAQRNLDPAIIDIFQIITDIGKSEWYLVPTGIICLLLVYVDWRGLAKRQQVWLSSLLFDAWFMFTAIIGSGITTIIAKQFIGRARPRHFETLGPAFFDPLRFEASFASFPSGHATTIGALATVLALRFPQFRVVIIPLALVVGGSRVVVGAHYPSDVIMGLAVGMLFTLMLARFFATRKIGFRVVDNGPYEQVIPKRRVLRGASPLGFGGIFTLGKRLLGFGA